MTDPRNLPEGDPDELAAALRTFMESDEWTEFRRLMAEVLTDGHEWMSGYDIVSVAELAVFNISGPEQAESFRIATGLDKRAQEDK